MKIFPQQICITCDNPVFLAKRNSVMLNVSELYIYPIKSLGGIAVNKMEISDRGFKYDRRWMLVNANNRFISQREVAQMALTRLTMSDNDIQVHFTPQNSSFSIPYEPQTNECAEVTIWDDTCTAQFVSHEADTWFSAMLQIPCRLVYMPNDTRRITDERYSYIDSITSFSDAYPFLIIGQASLDDLNNRLTEPLPVNRFRPNIVFTGGEPFQEDTMHTLTIGDVTFHGVKLCDRCVVTTTNQSTAIRGKEPLRTLAQYRSKGNKILFGQNLVHNGLGEIAIGDELQVIKLNQEDRFYI